MVVGNRVWCGGILGEGVDAVAVILLLLWRKGVFVFHVVLPRLLNIKVGQRSLTSEKLV